MATDIISTVEKDLRGGQFLNNPHGAAEMRSRLSGEFSFYTARLSEILITKPQWWNQERKNHKSDKACERAYEATENGINQMGIEMILKRLQSLITGLNTIIRLAESEIKNMY